MASSGGGDVSSLFAKKKGKKGKRGVKGYNLNVDSGIPKTEEVPKTTIHNDILGGPEEAEDDGWAEVVEKKRVVATGGKQVAELIDMTELMSTEETMARKLEKEDIKQAFHDARTTTMKPQEDAAAAEDKVEDKEEGASKSIFGSGSALGWKERMRQRELKELESKLSVDNTAAFPSLADAMSGNAKPQEATQPQSSHHHQPWARGSGRSAAAAAIAAALGQNEEPEEDKRSKNLDTGVKGPEGKVDGPPPQTTSPPAQQEAAPGRSGTESMIEKPPETTLVPSAEVREAQEELRVRVSKLAQAEEEGDRKSSAVQCETAADAAGENSLLIPEAKAEAGGVEGAAPAAGVGVDKPGGVTTVDADELVKQFGEKKKKKKKKKPTEEEQS